MLNVKKILVPLQGTPLTDATLATAYLLSQNYDAHLAVLHIRPDKKDVIPLTGEGLSGTMIEEVMNIAEHEGMKRLKFARQSFDAFVDENNIKLVNWGNNQVAETGKTASFTALTGRENDVATYWSRLSDITVVTHPNSGAHISSSEMLHALLFESGRPILIAPKEKPTSIGKRVCIAWNGSAESAAALHAALRWMGTTEQVAILYSEDFADRGGNIQDIVDYLKFNDLNVELCTIKGDRHTGESMIAACKDFNADLLCMGAYSHPRWKQIILGGVTSYMLENASLPVLMNR
ncbi:universal stress protein [Commensalibacter nepenthis]|uniref:Universal stress protein n=1 Tax=Commensalibacter nepenthis TaxID=3043872 RepID=A0ABT6Q7F4_9PROT|nr:universal stress protein [Commensalibacter sp. TBRC 10068]MDI2112724.1 universal stress protein [Commensalibacter sp. TBRC 10068]